MEYKDHLEHSYSALTLMLCRLQEAQSLTVDPDYQRIIDGCLPALNYLRHALDRLVGCEDEE